MTKTEALTEIQANTLKTVLLLAVTAENGEVGEEAARKAGAKLPALSALVRKGILVRRNETIDRDAADYPGENYWYSAA